MVCLTGGKKSRDESRLCSLKGCATILANSIALTGR
jgi:hypothetical protein